MDGWAAGLGPCSPVLPDQPPTPLHPPGGGGVRVPMTLWPFFLVPRYVVAWMPDSRGCVGLAGEGCEPLTLLKPARVGVALGVSGPPSY